MITIINTGSLQLTLTPESPVPYDFQHYKMKAVFPMTGYTHEELIISPTEDTAIQTAKNITSMVIDKLRNNLDDAKKYLDGRYKI